jgi:hypothetical protein
MRHTLLWLAVIPVAFALVACSKPAETPPEVTLAYRSLLSSLDPGAPGASFARLQGFARQNSRYAIASTVETEVTAWRSRLEEAYLKGRDLAREAQFDSAEAILADLAANLQEEKVGKTAREFLHFDFPFMKASRLLLSGDTAAAETIVKGLTKKRLTEEQMATAQRFLDGVSTANAGARMVRTTALKSAARSLQVLLHGYYAENGEYPKTLTMESPEIATLRESGGLFDGIAAIDDYKATRDEFSFVLTGKGSREQYRITQSTVEGIQPAARP